MSVIIYSILSANTAVSAVVGDRIYPLIDNSEYDVPFITFQRINTTPHPTKSGVSRLDEQRYQINVVAATPFLADQLCELVRSALDYASGTFSGERLQQAFFENQSNAWYDNVITDGACMVIQDYTLIVER